MKRLNLLLLPFFFLPLLACGLVSKFVPLFDQHGEKEQNKSGEVEKVLGTGFIIVTLLPSGMASADAVESLCSSGFEAIQR